MTRRARPVTLTQQRLKELFFYDPETGHFTSARSDRRSERPVGHIQHGYVRLLVDGERYAAHRLAFLYMTGQWPAGEVDHKNGAKTDNRWENLRDVTVAMNRQNLRRANSRNKVGLLGVRFVPGTGRYRAMITVSGKDRSIGTYDTAEAAHAAYLSAKRQFHEGNTL